MYIESSEVSPRNKKIKNIDFFVFLYKAFAAACIFTLEWALMGYNKIQ